MLIPGSERPPTMSRARSGGGRSGAAARPVRAAFAAIITDRTLAERRHPGVGVVGVAHSVNHEAVAGALLRHRVDVGQHLAAHVGEDHAGGAQLGPVGGDGRIGQVPLDRLVVEIALRDEQIGAPGDGGEIVGPLGVAAVGDDLAADLHAQRGGVRLPRMPGRPRVTRRSRTGCGAALRQLDPLQREARRHHVRAGEERLADLRQPLPQVARPGDGQRPLALGRQHRVDEQERHAAAVVAVQVGEQDGIDRVGGDPLLGQGDERGGPEVDRHPRAGPVHQDASLEPPPAAERVAAADEPDRHGHPLSDLGPAGPTAPQAAYIRPSPGPRRPHNR